MIAVTVWATLEEDVIRGSFHVVSYRWGWATVADAYCGFITFFSWVAYKERTWISRGCWLIAILLLGNIAMSTYVLLQIRRLQPGQSFSSLLLRSGESSPLKV
jgi:hypothetical protein